MRFAWLEYEDSRDGVAFCRRMTGFGWRNLFLDLAPTTPKPARTDLGHPDLKIRWAFDDKPNEPALFATPDDSHKEFIESWIPNPGVGDGFRLTSSSNAIDQADLLVVSGHGTGRGDVHDVACGLDAHVSVAKAFEEHATAPCTGRLKYLLVAACNNLRHNYASRWMAALLKKQPVHGVLGYSLAYAGDADGASVLFRFALLLHSTKNHSVLQAWRIANGPRPWGAIVHASSAKEDTVARWRSDAGLQKPDTSGTASVLHFDHEHPDGRSTERPALTANYRMPDGTIIDEFNGSLASVGLFPGDRGALIIKRRDGVPIQAGTLRVVFAFYRFNRRGFDLSKILTFDAAPGVQAVRDGNPEKPVKDGTVDAVDVTLNGSTKEVVLKYTVNKTVGPSSDMLVMELFAPGSDFSAPSQAADASINGAFVKR
ncbi:MAG: hypothetical protein WKG00_23270 [Polyangiaceae bacterium]